MATGRSAGLGTGFAPQRLSSSDQAVNCPAGWPRPDQMLIREYITIVKLWKRPQLHLMHPHQNLWSTSKTRKAVSYKDAAVALNERSFTKPVQCCFWATRTRQIWNRQISEQRIPVEKGKLCQCYNPSSEPEIIQIVVPLDSSRPWWSQHGHLCTEPYPESLSSMLGCNPLGIKTLSPWDSKEGRFDSGQIPECKIVKA